MSKEIKIPSGVKTQCGREKYQVLAKRDGLIAKIRLIWFTFFATIQDIKINKKG